MTTLNSAYQYIGRSSVMTSTDGSLSYYLLLYAKTAPNQATGIHTVTIKSVLASTTTNATYFFYTQAHNGKINGANAFSGTDKPSDPWELSNFTAGGVTYKTGTLLGEGSVNVDCTNGQANDINISCYYAFNDTADSYTPAKGTNRTVSVTVTLPMIASASTITTAADVTLGNNCSVTWTPKSASFRYRLKFEIGGWSSGLTGIIHPNRTSAYPYNGYRIPIDVANQFKTRTGTMTVTLYTYSDSNATVAVGSPDSKTFTVTVPDTAATKPTVSMVLAPLSTLGAPFNGLYLQSKTRVSATLNAETKYGADIKTSSITVEGTAYGYPYKSGLLAQVGTQTIRGSVMDSRDHEGFYESKITVIPYSKPKIQAVSGENNVVAARCGEDGKLDSSGKYLQIKAQIAYEKVIANGVQNNFGKIQYRYRAEGGTWSDKWETILDTKTSASEEVVTEPLLNGALSVKINYQVQVRAIDDIDHSEPITLSVPSENVYMDRPAGGKSMGLGGYSTGADKLDIYWKTVARGGLFLLDAEGNEIDAGWIRHARDYIIEQGTTNDGWFYRKWASGRAECWGTPTIQSGVWNGANGLYYTTKPVPLPTKFFAALPNAIVAVKYASGGCVAPATTRVSSETQLDVSFARFYGGTDDIALVLSVYAYGSWK